MNERKGAMSGLTAFTLFHVALSLSGLGAGVVVLFGFIRGRRLDGWTVLFLTTTIATSVTGFGFPFVRVLPAHVVGVISLVVLGVALFARYSRQLAGPWRLLFVLSSVTALYLNAFVAIAQLFRRVPFLHALAPTESEPPLMIAEVALLFVVAALGLRAVKGFGAEASLQTKTARAPQV
jgi:hypothetical protein